MTNYRIWDREEREFVGNTYKVRNRAARAADKLNYNWGATRYFPRINTI